MLFQRRLKNYYALTGKFEQVRLIKINLQLNTFCCMALLYWNYKYIVKMHKYEPSYITETPLSEDNGLRAYVNKL